MRAERIQEYEYQEISSPSQSNKKGEKLKVIKGRKGRNKAFFWSFIVFLSLFVVIARYSQLTKLNYEIASLDKSLRTQNAINSDLSVELDKKINLPKVRHVAQTQMAMKIPETNQIIYIEVPRSNKTEAANPPKGFIGKLEEILVAIKEGLENLKAIFG